MRDKMQNYSTGDICIVCRQPVTKTYVSVCLPIRQSFAVHNECSDSFDQAMEEVETGVETGVVESQLALSICRAINQYAGAN